MDHWRQYPLLFPKTLRRCSFDDVYARAGHAELLRRLGPGAPSHIVLVALVLVATPLFRDFPTATALATAAIVVLSMAFLKRRLKSATSSKQAARPRGRPVFSSAVPEAAGPQRRSTSMIRMPIGWP
jgi:hypothetical protein